MLEAELSKLRETFKGQGLVANFMVRTKKKEVELVHIFVEKNNRRQGIASAFMTEVIAKVRKHGYRVTLIPDSVLGSPLPVLMKFYTNLGFRLHSGGKLFLD